MPPPPPPTLPSSQSGTSLASIQRRRRKHDENENHKFPNNRSNGSNGKPTAGANNERRSDFKRKLFRGDRKKVSALSVIACVVLVLWISIFRLQYIALNNSNLNGSTKTIDSKKHSDRNDSAQKAANRIGDTGSDSYDSIFCRAESSTDQRRGDKQTPPNQKANPVFLWGIPSTTSKFEIGRRELLRKTYLNFFQQIQRHETYRKTNATTPDSTLAENKNLICSFHEWTCDPQVRIDCQMIYVFFVGGHDKSFNATTLSETTGTPDIPSPILVSESITNFRDMLLPQTQNKKAFNISEPGTVYLDIRENQFDGKMTTWFKFASLVAKEYNPAIGFPEIQYVFKVDSDLMLFTPHFFRWFNRIHKEQQIAKRNSNHPVQRVYGGVEFPATNCIENFTFDHACPLPLSGPSYMSGELNFMSVDLATYIASDDCPRKQWTIPHEDVSLSNYVYSYTNNTKYHKRERESGTQQGLDDNSIHIVSVNTSNILLLPNMKANWETVNIRKTPDILRNGELFWAHSITRGNHTQYLYWKKDAKFRNFWRLFMKYYTTTGRISRGKKKTNAAAQGSGNSLSKFQSELRKRIEEKNHGPSLQETGQVQSF